MASAPFAGIKQQCSVSLRCDTPPASLTFHPSACLHNKLSACSVIAHDGGMAACTALTLSLPSRLRPLCLSHTHSESETSSDPLFRHTYTLSLTTIHTQRHTHTHKYTDTHHKLYQTMCNSFVPR